MTIDSLSFSYHTMCCVTKLRSQLRSTYFQIIEAYSPPMQYLYALQNYPSSLHTYGLRTYVAYLEAAVHGSGMILIAEISIRLL